jgi:hypothetical protein
MHLTNVAPICLVAVAVLVAASLAQQPETVSGRAEGVVLLRNGRILQGEIVLDGDRYEVSVPGGRISVKAADVALCCRSLEEVYQQRRAGLCLASARDCVELAQWCQRHGLVEHAAEELARAEAIEPNHPLISLLRRGLELAKSVPAVQPPSVEVRGQDFSTADLDRMVREMPPGTVESFAEIVQPLLVNRCTAAACHGPSSTTGFSLLRSAPGQPPSRRLTQRNLGAVLDQIDRENAAASRLLTAAIRAHGSAESPVFGSQNASQYQQLVDWVFRVVQFDQTPEAPPRLELKKPPPETVPAVYLDSVAAEAAEPDETQASWAQELQGLNLGSASAAGPFEGESFPDPGLVQPWPKVQRGAKLPQFVPKDPFDPEIFNRRFHERQDAAGGQP